MVRLSFALGCLVAFTACDSSGRVISPAEDGGYSLPPGNGNGPGNWPQDAGSISDGGTPIDGGNITDAGTVTDGGTLPPPPRPPPAPPMKCDVKAYGAKGDGKIKDTLALQKAIDACAVSPSGSVVILSKGTFLTGTIHLASHMTLRIDADATLLGTQDDADYPDLKPNTKNGSLGPCRKALVYAENVDALTIEGGGTINGNGRKPAWVGVNHAPSERHRPIGIWIVLSRNLTIQNITLKDAAMWGLVPFETDNVILRHLTIDSTPESNRDGIDIVDCHHVLIEDCLINTDDDSICLKTGSPRGVSDVYVHRNVIARSVRANGLKLGTASSGSFRDIVFDDISISHVDKSAMAVDSVDGAAVKNISFRNIRFHDVGAPLFVILGDRNGIGGIEDLLFENIVGDGVRNHFGSWISGSVVNGVTHQIKNVRMSHMKILTKGGLTSRPKDPLEFPLGINGAYPECSMWGDSPAYGFFVRHVDGISFDNVSVDPDAKDVRPMMLTRDVSNISIH